MTTSASAMQSDQDQRRARNLRTSLILASIALAFLVGFVLRRAYQ
jgi:hypothetical protein